METNARYHRPTLATLLLLVAALAAGCGFVETDEGYPPPRNPWRGYEPSKIESTTVDGRTKVTAWVEYKQLRSSPAYTNSEHDWLIMKVLWRVHRGRIDEADLVSTKKDGTGTFLAVHADRAQLERRFGARPAGLDEGRTPQALQPGDGPYRNAEAKRMAAGMDVVYKVLQQTTREQVKGQRTWHQRGEREECQGGFTDKPTGKFRTGVKVDVPQAPGTYAAATLPELAAYWSKLGLYVDTSELDRGEDRLRAKIPDVAQFIASVSSDDPKAAHVLTVAGGIECLKP